MLWGSDLTRRAKTFLWRITMHGLYTLDRGHKLGHGDGFCMACLGIRESLEHIFFHCFNAQRGWAGNALFFEPDPYSSYLVDTNSFINILDSALDKTTKGIGRIYVIYQTAWTLWLHHNIKVYQNRPLRFAPQINAELAKAYLEVDLQYMTLHKKRRRMSQAVTYIVPYSREWSPTTHTLPSTSLEELETDPLE